MSEIYSETTSLEDSFLELYRAEEKYWWSRARRSLVNRCLSKYIQFPEYVRLLDAGCGGGSFLASLSGYCRLFGLEYSFSGAQTTSLRANARVVRGSSEDLPFKDRSFEVVTSLDVLEHLEDENGALKEFHRTLNKSGTLVLTVPAFNFLWSQRDEILGHKRRYTVAGLRSVLEKAGFKIIRCTYTDSFYFPGLLIYGFIKRLFMQKKGGRKDTVFILSLPAWIESIFEWLLKIERNILNYIDLPIGVSIICIAQKEDKVDE